MSVFQLYKKRNFSAYLGDTVQFFKQFGKNFFLNFTIINGALLLLMCIAYYLLLKSGLGNPFMPASTPTWLMNDGNVGLFLAYLGIFFLISIALGITSVAYPMGYFRLLSTTGKDNFTSTELFAEIKEKAGQIFLFGFISMFILMPLFAVFLAIAGALSIILIGIPLLLFGIPTMMVWCMQSLYVYLYEELGYFDALGKGWRIIRSNYMNVVGSSIILYICILVISSAVSAIPMIIVMFSMISSGNQLNPQEMPPLMIAIYVVNMILTFMLYNAIYVHQGLVYYSGCEMEEHHHAYSEIENIGRNEE